MDIETHRKTIDRIDHEILELLARRRKVVMQIGMWKKEQGAQVRDEKRWNEVLFDRRKTGEELGIPPEVVTSIWEQIHTWALEVEKQQ